MNTHRNDLAALSTAELRSRRDRLVAGLPQAAAFLAGSLVEQTRRCGKEGCRCARGELHGPYVYLSVGRGKGARLLYVPAQLAEAARRHITLTGQIEVTLAAISAINLELLARRELD